MAVTESELAGSFSQIGEDASDKDFIVKCEHMVKRERESARATCSETQHAIAGKLVCLRVVCEL